MEYCVTDIHTLKEKRLMQVEIMYRVILLIYTDDGLYAVQDNCPHLGTSLSTGKIENDTIRCKDHGLPISLKTGEVVSVRQADFLRLDKAHRKIQTYPVVVKEDYVYITL